MSDSAERLVSYVSPIYDKSYVGLSIFEVLGIEIDEVNKWVGELKYQAFPQTVTWAIEYWENRFNIPVDNSLDLDFRRRRLISKLTERAPLNPERVKKIATLASGVDVDVIEDIAPYTFSIVMPPHDIPINYASMCKKIVEIKPSHLSFYFYFKGATEQNIHFGNVLVNAEHYYLPSQLESVCAKMVFNMPVILRYAKKIKLV